MSQSKDLWVNRPRGERDGNVKSISEFLIEKRGRVCAKNPAHESKGWYTVDGETLCDDCGDARL